jgi:hypothetical protein
MFQGISLSFHSLPDSILNTAPDLDERTHRRNEKADPEVWFLLRDRMPLLPVWWEGQLRLVTWGRCRPKLPGLWQCPRADLEAGKWSRWEPKAVQIPADFGRDSGVWFDIREGLEGVVIQEKPGRRRMYSLSRQAIITR